MDLPERQEVRLRLGPVVFEAERGRIVHPDGAVTELRPKSAEVLRFLATHAGRLVTRAELLDAVWPDVFVTDDSLTQCITEVRRALGPVASAMIRTQPRRGYVLDAAPEPQLLPSTGPGVPVLAVLPFDNLSREPRWDRLCDGVVEDMITDLARCPDLRVIARTSSFAWRGRQADMREIGRALGAGYLLEGSVQAEAGWIGVTAQLIDARTGLHVWAQRFEHGEDDLFAVQADIVARVIAALAGFGGRIARAELQRVARRPPASLQAYELYLLGYEAESRLDRDGTLQALELLEQAVRADPQMSRAWTVLGFALGNAAANGWGGDAAALRARQQAVVRRAVELDPEDGVALEELGATLARGGDIDGAHAAFRHAAEAGARHADTLALLGKYMVEVLGEGGTAERMVARAFRLNPTAPAWYWLGATRVAFFTGDAEGALAAAERAPDLALPQLLKALALSLLGRDADAAACLARHQTRFGAEGIARAISALPPLCPDAAAVMRVALGRAGLTPII